MTSPTKETKKDISKVKGSKKTSVRKKESCRFLFDMIGRLFAKGQA